MTLNVRHYVEWLLNLPPAKLTPPIREFLPVLKTARLLDDLAYLAPDPDTIRRAAWRLWLAPFQIGLGNRPETHQAALDALKPFERFLTGQEATNARELIRGLSLEQLHAEPRIGRIPSRRYVEYRSRASSAHLLKLAGKKNPADDLSKRIWEAYYALKESGCPHPREYIAEVLNRQARRLGAEERWTWQRVESRLKAFKGKPVDAWPENDWRLQYTFNNPDSKEGPFPTVFEFEPWAGPAARTTNQ